MRLRILLFLMAVTLLGATLGRATIFGTVRGIVHDPQHHPIEGANVTLRAQSEDWKRATLTNADGEFTFDAVPIGQYTISIEKQSFRNIGQGIEVASGGAPILHFSMQLGTVFEKVEVSADQEAVDPQSSRTQGLVTRSDIERTPGADRANSLAMIADFVPSAALVHDQLHIRGGHQVSWLIDGVPVPNTNIADTVGPQIDPKNIDAVELQRGGYSAEYGDRTYAVFNVVPRSGFERNNEVEFVSSYGNFHQTDNQISFGSHTNRFAYYASVTGNRSDLGLMTPIPNTIHDINSGAGGFGSIFFNVTPHDQLRWVASVRMDHFQVPNAPDDQAAGVRNFQRERDAFVNFSWVRTVGTGVLLTVAPFYHFNGAALDAGPNDASASTYHRASQYAGGQASLAVVAGRHNARVGLYGFAQRDSDLFAQDSGVFQEKFNGGLEALFLEDQFRLTNWLSLNGGVRLTHFDGLISENAASPRAGAALRIPRLNWVLRGYYGRYYQAPPLATVSGPLLDSSQQGFLRLAGERDEQQEFGLAIPLRGWIADFAYFRTKAHNFFDHDVLGNSNIFLPVTIDRARIHGWESTLRSPRLWRRARLRLNYSNQVAEGRGGVTGGLTSFNPPPEGFFFLDHDQRNTLTLGFETSLPWRSWASSSYAYGSGFLTANGPAHLPSHNTFSFAIGKSFGESFSVQFYALNAGNNRFLLDQSNTFGGTHFNYPRQVAVQVRYRFHY